MKRGAAFDVQAVCSGFIFALAVADNALRLGQARTALVIGAETFSRILDWQDRGTCVLFGDGAGAIVLQGGSGGPASRGVLSTHLHSDGRQHDILYVDGGPSSTGTAGMSAHGRPRGVPPSDTSIWPRRRRGAGGERARGRRISTGWCRIRRIPASSTRSGASSGCPPAGRCVTIERHANTSAASIPLALDEAVSDGRIRPGHLVLMEALGGGLTWGASVVRW